MHSQSHRWTTITALIAAVVVSFIAPGCRGSKPFGRFVKVTQGAEADLPHVDPPQQRLATTSRPRVESESSRGGIEVSMTAESVGENPSGIQSAPPKQASNRSDFAVNRQPTASDRSASGSDRRTLQQDILRRDDSSRGVNSEEQFAAKVNAKRNAKRTGPSPQVERLASQRTSVAKTGQPNADIQLAVEAQHSDLLDAFADYPPEVQREALRRLVAATSKSAKKTDQPTGFDTELQKHAQHLPELPPAKNSAADVPATRLGTRPRRSSSVVTVADKSRPHEKKSMAEPTPKAPSGRDLLAQQQKAAQQKIAAMTHRVSNLATGVLEPAPPSELEMPASHSAGLANDPIVTAGDLGIAAATTSAVVASVGDLETDSSNGSVQPASAIRPADAADEMIARAVSQDSAVPQSVLSQTKSGMVPSDINSLTDEQLYRALVKQLSTAAEGESDAQRSSRLIKLRHLMVLSGDVDSAVKEIEGMPESEQEFLRHQLLGLWTMVDPSGHPVASRRITTALPQLRQATQFAAAATDSLEVRSVAFCSEIESYGQIKPFKSNRFDPGQQVILYCEIENFSAKKGDDGYVTEMQGSYDIFDANNQKVVSQLLPADRQVSSNYLRDYYIAYQMHLPKQLPAGDYRLQLTMEDVGGKKYGQSSIDLEIGK